MSLNTVEKTKPIVWTIAGSDSGGGAGIQADSATILDLEAHACTVITAVTSQNSVAVTQVDAVSNEMLLAQLNALLTDLPPAAIKVGLITNQAQLNTLAQWFAHELANWQRDNHSVPVILDPVMVASTGCTLIKTERLDFTPFKSLLTLITPNARELRFLVDKELTKPEQVVSAAQRLSKEMACSVLVKGGDVGAIWQASSSNDLLVCHQVAGISSLHQEQSFWLASPRIKTTNNHGTGCTLSSAIACVMAHGFTLTDGVVVAKAYVNEGLLSGYQLGQGAGCLSRNGWPHKLELFPNVVQLTAISVAIPYVKQPTLSFQRINEPLGLYAVVADLEKMHVLLKAGAKTIQLRIKDKNDPQLEQKISQAVSLGRDYNAKVFINDYWQLAIKHQAYGVHLGQEDLFDTNLQQLSDANIALGLSSHSYFEIILAKQFNPSYIAFGHVFPTTTKVMPSAPQGLQKLTRYVSLLKGKIPTVAIGGIDSSNVALVKATGVDEIAVVRAITEADDLHLAFQTLSNMWHENCVQGESDAVI